MLDRTRMLEVVQNLLDNAIKFSAANPDRGITVDAVDDGEKVVCSVRDNGPGIEPRYHEKIFKMFKRLDQKFDGTGAGLALVRGIVEAHGGSVWVESEGVGRGCAFRFSLPRTQ